MLDLTPIVARAEAARAAWPGPWRPYRKVYEGIGILSEGVVALNQGDRAEEVCWCSGDDAQRAATAEFIADAPTDLAALVAEVQRLRAAEEARVAHMWRVHEALEAHQQALIDRARPEDVKLWEATYDEP